MVGSSAVVPDRLAGADGDDATFVRGNALLAALDGRGRDRILHRLETVSLRPRQVIYEPNQPIGYVYFPETSVVSLLAVMANGDSIETATVGREGASWISGGTPLMRMPCATCVVIGGTAHRLHVRELHREVSENAVFRQRLESYSHALWIHVLRTAACNGVHTIAQRCARWMLTTVDRVGSERFAITHDFLASLLGASRPSVSVTVQKFRWSGIVRVERGRISILDRDRLVEHACECYQVIRDYYEQTHANTAEGY